MTPPNLQDRVVVLDRPKYHGPLRDRRDITLIVMHCTAGAEAAPDTIKWMNGQSKPISYHYVIDRDGTIYRMTAIDLVAYHAGDSAFPSDPSTDHQGKSVNHQSIGISWANRNDGEPLTDAQIESGLWLCGVFHRQLNIPVARMAGHCEVSPGRKTDPEPAMAMASWRQRVTDFLTESTP